MANWQPGSLSLRDVLPAVLDESSLREKERDGGKKEDSAETLLSVGKFCLNAVF